MADARASSTSEFGAFVSPTVDLKKKLSFTGALGTPGRGILEASAQPLRAYCRVRPLRPEERSKGVSVIRVDRPCTVRVMTREEAEAEAAAEAGAEAGALDSAGSSFTFDGVFDASTSQGELYTASFRPVVESAVHRGSHGLLFAYGMTSAGKTYTISGSDNAPGLLPRVLHSVFSEIKAARERETAKTARRISGADGEEDAGNGDGDSGAAAAGGEAEKTGEAAATTDGGAHEAGDASDSLGRRASDSTLARFTITVSYLEVYNEGVYDLLSDMPDEDAEGTATNEGAKAKGSRPPRHKGAATASAASSKPHRVQLRLKEGRDGRVYVRGLRTVTVPSLGRALEIMQQGAANKRVAETRLNADSSRSHTVFTVSIFRHDPVTGTAEGSSSSSFASASASSSAVTATASCRMSLWSRLSVVDLAGCERASRSGATGVRLKEAGNINRSLSALMNCLDALRHNHKAATAAAAKGTAAQLRMVPYRESKLTRLFSGALSGASRGAVVMVVNAGPAAADREETMRALKYGAVAREVRIVPRVDSSKGGAGAGKDGQPAVEYDMDGRRVRRGAASTAASTGEHGEGGDENATAENAGDAPKAVEGGGRRRAGIGARAGRVRRGRMGKRGALANATASSAAGDKPASHPAAGEEDTTGAGASKGGSGSSDAAKELADLRARFYREKDAWLEEKAALETEKEELRERWEEAVEALEAAQEEAARVEAEVREEVVSEMETRMVAMQAEWTKRAEANEARADARAQKLLGIAAQRTTAKKARAKASRLQELGAGENGEEGDETDTGSDLGTPFTSAASPIRGMPGFEQAPADAEEESSLAAAIRSAAEHEVARRLSARLSMLPGSASSRSSGGEDADGAREAPEGIQEGEEEDEEDSDEDEDEEDDGGLARSRVHRGVRLSSLSDGGAEADGFAMAEALARAEAAEAEAAELREAVAEGEAEASRVRERHVAELSALREDLEEARMDAAEAEAGAERSEGSEAGGAEEETVAELRERVNVLESKLREAEQRAEAAEKEAGVLRSKASDAESDAAALRVRVQALESHVRRHAAMPLAGLLESMKASSSAQQSMVGLAARAASPRASSQSSQQDIESKAPAPAPAEDEEQSIAEADAEASAMDEHEVDDEATEADSEDDSDAGITADAAKSVAPQPEPEDDEEGEEEDDEDEEEEDDDECWGTPPAVRPTRKGRAGGVRVPAASRAKKAAAGSVPPLNARGQRKPVYRSRRRAKLEEDEEEDQEEEKDEEGDEEEGGTASTGPRARPKRSSSPPLEEEEEDTEDEGDDEDDDEEEDDEEADEDEPSPSPVRARRTRRTRGNPAPADDDDDEEEHEQEQEEEEEDSAPIGRRLRARRARK